MFLFVFTNHSVLIGTIVFRGNCNNIHRNVDFSITSRNRNIVQADILKFVHLTKKSPYFCTFCNNIRKIRLNNCKKSPMRNKILLGKCVSGKIPSRFRAFNIIPFELKIPRTRRYLCIMILHYYFYEEQKHPERFFLVTLKKSIICTTLL